MTQDAGFEEQHGAEQPAGDQPIGRAYQARRRTAVRVLVPVAIAAIAATGVAVVPALASDSAPTLPQVTAEQLVTKVLANQTQALSGTVKVSTDLGIPSQLLSMVGHGSVASAVGGSAAAAGGSGQAKEGAGGSQADPTAKLTELLAGEHTLRIAADGPDRQRVALIDSLAEYDLIHNGDQAWAYDSASNQAVHLTDKTGRSGAAKQAPPQLGDVTTPQQAAQKFLAGTANSSEVTVAGTASVAGRSAYQLSVKPKQSGSTIAEVKIAVDSATGTPLAVVATSTSGATVLDVHFSDVSFAKPDAKTFDFAPPKGAKVTEQAAKPGDAQGSNFDAAPLGKNGPGKNDSKVIGSDWTAVLSAQLPSGQGEAGRARSNTAQGRKGTGNGFPDAVGLAKSLGKPVAGGTLISTKVINVLITDDGHVYAGAVTPSVLQAAAGVK